MKAFSRVKMIKLADFMKSYPFVKDFELFNIGMENGIEKVDRKNSICGNRQELLKIPKFKKDFWVIVDTFETGFFIFNEGKLIQGYDKEKECLTVFFYRFEETVR